jgi:hypothetical protein
MRGLIVEFTVLLFALTGQSLTQALSALPEPDKDPFVGTWQANAKKSRPKLDKINASYVRTMARDGDDLVVSSRIKRQNSAGFSENHYRIRCDGLPHPVQCGVSSCTTTCIYLSANRVEGDTAGPGGKTFYWTREISPDGQEMIVSGYADKDRTKPESIEVSDRVR